MQQQSQQQSKSLFGLDHFTCCLSVFDSRKGTKEGREDEKVLAFFPLSIATTTQTIIVGLAQALHGFSSTFSQVADSPADPYVLMDAHESTWVMFQCEPSIWLLLVASKAWLGNSISHAGLKAHLQTLHRTAVLLHGPIQSLMDKGVNVYQTLQPLLDEAGRLLVSPSCPRLRLASSNTPLTREASALANPLGLHGGVPLLVVPEQPYLGAQSLAYRLLNITSPPSTPPPTSAATSTHKASQASTASAPLTLHVPDSLPPVSGVHVTWHGMPVWSTLSCEDTAAVHSLVQRALLPAAGIGRKRPNALKAVLAAAAAAAATSTAYVLPASMSPSQPAASSSSAADPAHDTLLSPQQWNTVPLTTPHPATTRHHSQTQQQAPGQSTATVAVLQPTVNTAGRGAPASRIVVPAGPAAAAAPPPAGAGTTAAAAAQQPTAVWLFPALPQAAAAAARRAPPPPHEPAAPFDEDSYPTGPSASTSDQIANSANDSNSEPEVAQVWLQGEQYYAGLLPVHYGPLLVVLLLRPGAKASKELCGAAEEVLYAVAPTLASQLHTSLPTSSHLWHQKGYRYAHEDHAADSVRATPVKKVTTLTDGSLRLSAHTANKLDQWTHATGDAHPPPLGAADSLAADPEPNSAQGTATAGADSTAGPQGDQDGPKTAGSGLAEGGDHEVVIRTALDAWVDVRKAESRRMHVVLDQAPVPTLLGVSSHVQKLCDRLYPGYYAGFQ